MHGLSDLTPQEPEEEMTDPLTLCSKIHTEYTKKHFHVSNFLIFDSKQEAVSPSYPQSSLQQEPDQSAVVVRLKLDRLQYMCTYLDCVFYFNPHDLECVLAGVWQYDIYPHIFKDCTTHSISLFFKEYDLEQTFVRVLIHISQE